MEDSFIEIILTNVVNLLYYYEAENYEYIIKKVGLSSFNKSQFERLCSSVGESLKKDIDLNSIIKILIECNIEINNDKLEKVINNYKENPG